MKLSRNRKNERKLRAKEARAIVLFLELQGANPEELGVMLDVTPRTVYRWRDEERVPGRKVLESLRAIAKERGLSWLKERQEKGK